MTVTNDIKVMNKGDTYPPVFARLLSLEDIYSVDFNDISNITFHMIKRVGSNTTHISGNAEIVDPSQKLVKYEWNENDTAIPGKYRCFFEVERSDGRTEKFPQYGLMMIEIVETSIPLS